MRIWDPHGWNARLGQKLRYPDYDGIDGHQSIRLRHLRGDRYALEMMHSGPLGRPGMRVALDTAQGRRYRLRLDARGHVPAGVEVIAKPGEAMSLRGPKEIEAIRFHAPTEGEWWSAATLDEATWQALSHARLERAGFQGAIGDCWALGPVLAIVSTCPEALRETFGGRGGRVGVRLFDYDAEAQRHVPTSYLVDAAFSKLGVTTDHSRDHSPHATHRAADSVSVDPHLWLRLLEKALACRRGSHEGLSIGWPREAFEALLGAPAETLILDELPLEVITRRLLRAKEAREPVVLGSGARLIPKLLNAHIYAVRSIEVDDRGRLELQLHNPHGKKHHQLRGAQVKNWASQIWIGQRPPDPVP